MADVGTLAGIVLVSGMPVVALDAKPRQTITIPRLDAPPRLENYLSGQERPGAHVTDFLQRSPGDLTARSEQTDAYLSYDATNLYAVFVCRTTDPSRIRARISRREQMFSDDSVGLFLDTFNDRQRSYMFFSNPLGIQADGVTVEGQGDESLRFPAGTDPHTWGIPFDGTSCRAPPAPALHSSPSTAWRNVISPRMRNSWPSSAQREVGSPGRGSPRR